MNEAKPNLSAPGAITIRKAVPADALVLTQARYSFRAEINAMAEDREKFEARCLPWMEKNLTSERWHCWMATRDDELLGHIWLEVVEKMPNPAGEPEEHAYVTNFFVLPFARDQKLGAQLLERAVEWAEKRGMHALFLWPSERSVRFYERHGFEFGRVLEYNLHEKRKRREA